jgi:hypothetical protein
MGEMKGTYKGYELWLYEKGEKTSRRVGGAVSKGKRPEIAEFRENMKGVMNLINETLNKPPEKVETYKGVDIMFVAKTGRYEASFGSGKRKLEDLDKLRKWIDKREK